MKRGWPWWMAAAMAGLVVWGLWPPSETAPFHTADFGRLPVLLNGRVQPLDSVARNSLLILRNKQSAAIDGGGALSATEWLLETLMKPELADTRRAFRVDHPELRGMLHLPQDGPIDVPFKQIEGQIEEIEKQARRIDALPVDARSTFEKAVIRLSHGLTLYRRLKNTLRPETVDDFAAEIVGFEKSLGPGLIAWKLRQEGKGYAEQDLQTMVGYVQSFDFLANVAYPLMVPPAQPGEDRDAWLSIGASLLGAMRSGEVDPAVTHYAAMSTAFRKSAPDDFNRHLAEYRVWLSKEFAPEMRKAAREFVFNYWRPFVWSIVLYLLGFLLGCLSWFGSFPRVTRAAYGLLGVGFAVHTAGILFRMWLEGRPPVTNLYSSAVFVGWGTVALGLVLERFQRDGLGVVMASALGSMTLVVAHNLSLDGDTMEMLRAVLDTNFWLTTHVITITLGYSAMFVAGFLAIGYVVRGVFTRSLAVETGRALGRMVYGVLCFATLFSFIGTILGGIWADQSWGRFWGWDPKENGALIIVLWCAVVLHARWDGLVGERGLMNLAIFGNVVTSFSWFGVNMLGVGLHSYGFVDKAFVWLMVFVGSQLVLIGLGLIPERHWSSARMCTKPPAADGSGAAG